MIWNSNINTREEPLVTKIKFVDANTVELDDPPTRKMDHMCFAWGTDDTDAIQKTLNVAKKTGSAVYLPPGHFVVTKPLEYNTDYVVERDEGISYVPDPKFPKDHPHQYTIYPVMKQGLRMFGAGMQVSFLHNLILTQVLPDRYHQGRPTIIIDGTGGHLSKGGTRCCSWQQTGYLRDFHITATGHIDKTVGIDLIATWAYRIQNVAIMNMGFMVSSSATSTMKGEPLILINLTSFTWTMCSPTETTAGV